MPLDLVRISVIVPLSCEPLQALRCLEGIAAQAEAPAHEVIVVDDASIGLKELLDRLAGDVELIRLPHRLGFAGAAETAVERARGELVVLLRGAAVPAPGWLSALVTELADPTAGMTASTTMGGVATTPLAAWSVALRAADLRSTGIPQVPDQLVFAALALELAQRELDLRTAPMSMISGPGERTVGAATAHGAHGVPPELTIVIPTLDATSDRVRGCVAAVKASTEAPHEIVIVDNGAPPQGFSAPVNAGLRAARTPYVVVMNDDVEPLAGWWEPLRAAIDDGAAVAFPLTVDGPMRDDFAAWCFALGSESVEQFSHVPGEFFDPSLVIWYQDTDLLLALRRAGRPPVLVAESQIRHGLSQTVGSEDPELGAWVRVQVAADRRRFMAKHSDATLRAHVLVDH
jgi:GT2 family glycosyltransferase